MLSVCAILAAATAPGMSRISAAMSLESDSQRVAMALTQGRVAAINRGHVVVGSFTSNGYQVVDTQNGNEVLAMGTLSPNVTLSATAPATFSTLGTVTGPVVVTLQRNTDSHTRLVRVGLTGMVEIE